MFERLLYLCSRGIVFQKGTVDVECSLRSTITAAGMPQHHRPASDVGRPQLETHVLHCPAEDNATPAGPSMPPNADCPHCDTGQPEWAVALTHVRYQQTGLEHVTDVSHVCRHMTDMSTCVGHVRHSVFM